ncbi:HMCN1, partial [Symbiodinium pilosum]
DHQMDQIIEKLKKVQEQSPGGSLPDAAKLDQILQGGKEVLRVEGDLYLYSAHADAFLSNPQVQEVFELLIAGKAQIDTRNVEVKLSIPQRIVEAEWQKKAK